MQAHTRQSPSPGSSEEVTYELPTNTWHTQSAQDLVIATNEALRSTGGFSITLLTVCAFLFLATLSTGHEDLLRREAISIPLFQVPVDLVWFFGLAPWVVLALHLDLLLRTRLTMTRLDITLTALSPLPREDRISLIRSLHIMPIAEWMVSSCREEEDRFIRRLLGLVVLPTLIVFPAIILFWMLMDLLPLHHHLASWTQVIAFSLDLIAIYLLWPLPQINCEDRTPSVQNAEIRLVDAPHLYLAIAVLLLLGVLVCVLFWVWPLDVSERSLTVRDLGHCPPLEAQSKSLGEIQPLNLKGRDLRGIQPKESRLPHADLAGADLKEADLSKAYLPHANLAGANLQNAQLAGACLRSAHLNGAVLDGSQAKDARLEDANLEGASMKGIIWEGAQLRGASLRDAEMIDDIELNGADLRGADLHGAEIQGTDLTGVDFSGARLDKVLLRNSDLNVDTNLRLADLEGMVMESLIAPADFRGATMRAVDFGTEGQATKANLRNAKLTGADLRETAWFATDHQGADFSLADLRQALPCPSEHPDCHSPPSAFVAKDKPCLLGQAAGPCIGEDRIEEYDTKLAEFLIGLACEDDPAEDGPQGVADRYRLGCALLHRLRRTLKDEPDRPLLKHLAKGLQETSCPGMPRWEAETREDLWRLRLDDGPPKRIRSELCPAGPK